MNTDLSAFYFDIRKDALYCEPYSSAKRKAALETIEQIFRCTMRCGWRRCSASPPRRRGSRAIRRETGSVHVELFPDVPASWRDDALAEKWEAIKRVRRVVTGALEIERAAKKIGSSLEAAPQVYIADPDLMAALEGVDLAEVCITSGIDVRAGERAAGRVPARRRAGRRRGVAAGARAQSARARGASRGCRDPTPHSRAVRARRRGRARVRCDARAA